MLGRRGGGRALWKGFGDRVDQRVCLGRFVAGLGWFLWRKFEQGADLTVLSSASGVPSCVAVIH